MEKIFFWSSLFSNFLAPLSKILRTLVVTGVFNFNIYAFYLSTNRGTLVVYIAQTVYVLHRSKYQYIAICSIDVIVDDFDRFDLFYFDIDNFPSRIFFFCFFHRHKNLNLLFHPRFSLISFIFLIFKLIVG